MTSVYSSKNIFFALESLRGVAALYVVVSHAHFILFIGGNQYLIEHPISSQDFF